MIQELVGKYIWLIDLFSKAAPKGLSLEQVLDRWERRWGETYNRRSFFNHRSAVMDIFGVEIRCDRSSNLYYIDADELEMNKSKASWLINSFTVNNLMSLAKEGLAGRVSVENIPSGQKWLTTIMNAMLDGDELLISYLKYTGDSSPQERIVLPYALKESGRRWYLVGWDLEREALRMYGLDRIKSIEPTGRQFTCPDDFDVDVLFRSSFGAYITGRKDVRHIVLRAGGKEANYLRDLPLHDSQREPFPGLFTIDVAISEDLVMELLRHGSRLEVIEPEELRSRLALEHRCAANVYDK